MIKITKHDTLFTDFNDFIRRSRRRFLVKQAPKVIWMTGLSGAGKSTLSIEIQNALRRKGYFTKIFDGDIVRTGLCKDLGYSLEDRLENIRRIAELSKIFVDSGIIVICSFISPTHEMRQLAKEIIGENNFIEVYINAPLHVCEKRDVKGLYAKARQGLITNFTGIDSVFEPPLKPDIEVRTDLWSIDKTARYMLRRIIPKVKFRKITIDILNQND
ncbi:MAG TPA: adenylyl-sulfate kinase [Bacteroidales bacterium]|nr:adenylyl-sulfate kinase [Bacteroidales bacterium]HRZ50004.1 adenylyl-sulfate kinase [Bacteroidales bacterium]